MFMPPARLVLVVAALAAAPALPAQTTAYVGATLWDGTGAPPVPGATLVVRAGRVVAAGRVPVPTGAREVDVAGRWIVPGLIDAHAHVSGRWAAEGVEDAYARVEQDLLLFARYGVTTVNSLGGEPPEAGAVRAAERDGPPARARLHFAGPVLAPTTFAEAHAAVAANAERGVDWIKIRVDDNLGTSEKMPWPAVRGVMEASAARGLRVATHLFYLEDARRLLSLGSGLVAHSVRDADVDDAFVAQLGASGVCYVPTLTREVSTFVYGDRPDFFDDPFFRRYAHAGEVARASDPGFVARQRTGRAAARYREALVQAQANLVRLSEGGVTIAFGTDAGPAARFPGYFEHMELELMVEAGLTPEQALRAATGDAARCLGLDDMGTLEPGRWADFVVLRADPLADISATRSLEAVFVGGRRIP